MRTSDTLLATEPEVDAEAVPAAAEGTGLEVLAVPRANAEALGGARGSELSAEEEAEEDLIEGTQQYQEAIATLQAWFVAAGVEGRCLDTLRLELEEGEIISLGRFRRAWPQLVSTGRISIGTLHLVDNALAAEELMMAEPAGAEAQTPGVRRLSLSQTPAEAVVAAAAVAVAAGEAASVAPAVPSSRERLRHQSIYMTKAHPRNLRSAPSLQASTTESQASPGHPNLHPNPHPNPHPKPGPTSGSTSGPTSGPTPPHNPLAHRDLTRSKQAMGDPLHARPRINSVRVHERVAVMVENEEAIQALRRQMMSTCACACACAWTCARAWAWAYASGYSI